MARPRCEICDRLIPPMDFSFRLAKGEVCSSCVVMYGFRVADRENPVEPEIMSDRTFPLPDTPTQTIHTQLPAGFNAVEAAAGMDFQV